MSNLTLGVEVSERFRAVPAQRAQGVSALAARPVSGPHAGREGVEDHAEAVVSKLVGSLLRKAAKIRQDGLGKILGRVGVGLASRAQLLPESGDAVVGCFLETPEDVVALGILGGRILAFLLEGKARHEDTAAVDATVEYIIKLVSSPQNMQKAECVE
jgi:hypothetical protein